MAKNKQVALNLITLATLVGFGGNGTYLKREEAQPLVDAGHAEFGPEQADGTVAVRATDAGVAAHAATLPAGTPDTAPVAAPVKAKRSFTIDSDIPVPASSNRGGRRGSTYPFEALEVNQSFFIADEDTDSKDAVRSMASTVAAQNIKYSEPVPGETRVNRKGNTVEATKQTRKFIVRSVTENGVKGARIFRVSL